MVKNSHALVHELNSQLKQKNAHYTNVKTLEEMFIRALYRLHVEALQSSLNVSDHPETTSKPKYGLNAGQVVCVHSVWSRSLNSTVELGYNVLYRYKSVLL